MQVRSGNPTIMGANLIDGVYNFSFANASSNVTLLLFSEKKKHPKYKIKFEEDMRFGDVYSMAISGIDLSSYFYAYEIDKHIFIDPYAKEITDCGCFGKKSREDVYISPICLPEYDWEGDRPLDLDYKDSIFYKLNVRGYTKSKTSKVKEKGTFRGIIEKLPYLKDLGITTIELMPAYEFDEIGRFYQLKEDSILSRYGVDTRFINGEKSSTVNFWGYTRGFYFAPKASFSSRVAGKDYKKGYSSEFKDLVKEAHKAGIEVVMEMFFVKESVSLCLDCVRYWVNEYHIDGVHVYGEETILKAIASDPMLSKTKVLTVFWEGNKGTYKHMANYNNDFQNVVRQLLKGDENQLQSFINVTKNNPTNSAVINYITNNNGFTLTDLVSYDRKHNELNGENNRDGENFNYSWNCGEEGPTKKRKIIDLRLKQIKNALTMVILSAGTPLILAGDEFANSQEGNNNPYCVDSEVSWLTWKETSTAKKIFDWTKTLIDFRKKYAILHQENPLSQTDRLSIGFPDLSYHGNNAWFTPTDNFIRQVGMMYSAAHGEEGVNELIYIAYNMHWEEHELALPKIDSKEGWKIVMCSATKKETATINEEKRTVLLAPRSVAILVGEYKPFKKGIIITPKLDTSNNNKIDDINRSDKTN
ncbi:MAG: alpha-amylase [Lachnospira sp.]|nr:alpha-amylase [Lachnospira sp.]